MKQEGKTESLTERELQVLQQLTEARLNKEIATSLRISLDTVKKHIKNIYRKINARNRIEAVNYASQLKSQKYPSTISENVTPIG